MNLQLCCTWASTATMGEKVPSYFYFILDDDLEWTFDFAAVMAIRLVVALDDVYGMNVYKTFILACVLACLRSFD